jgi:elongation factor G
MAKYESKMLRNLAVIGHGGTGKTSLCESLLYVSGKNERLGRVDDNTSTMDFEPEEQKKHVSISSAANFVEWDKHKINIVDTPGDSNFTFDIKCSMSVVDNTVVVIDSVGGVEFQTQKAWEIADEYSLPRLIFVNRMDRERADFNKVLESIKTKLKKKATPVCLPIGAEDKFQGIVDLIAMKAYIFADNKGVGKASDIPADLMDEASLLRGSMVEDIAEADDELMNKYLEAGELSDESNAPESQRERKISLIVTGSACNRDKSRLKYRCDRLLIMLLKSKRVKKVMIIMERSFMARISPKSCTL